MSENRRPLGILFDLHCILLAADGVLLLERVLGRGCELSPENSGTFSLEMAHFGGNSIVYFNRNVRLFTAGTTTVTVYCWRLTGPFTGKGSVEGL